MNKKALVIRFSSIGDIILTTPAIRCLANQGNYEVYLLTKKEYSQVLIDNPYLSHIIIYKNLITTSKKVRAQNFDIIIDLHKSLRSIPLRALLFQKYYSFKKLRTKRWMRTILKNKLDNDRHIALRFMDALKPLGLEYDDMGLDYFIPSESKVPLPSQKERRNVGLVPGANFYTKTIPIKVLSRIVSHWPEIHFHIVGGQKEEEKFQELHQFANVTDHCGKLSLTQSASILNQCELVITSDTALMHISAALNKKIISIWGGTVPEFGFYPFLPKESKSFEIIENKILNCRPCSKSGMDYCPKGHFNCMNSLSTKDINNKIKNILFMNHLDRKDVIKDMKE